MIATDNPNIEALLSFIICCLISIPFTEEKKYNKNIRDD